MYTPAGNKELETVKKLWERELRTLQAKPNHSGTKTDRKNGTKTDQRNGTKTDQSNSTKTDHSATKTDQRNSTKTDHSGTKTDQRNSTKTDQRNGTKTDKRNSTKKVPSPSTARGPTTTRGQVNTGGQTTTKNFSSSSSARNKTKGSAKSKGSRKNSPPIGPLGSASSAAPSLGAGGGGVKPKFSAERVTPQTNTRKSAIESLLSGTGGDGVGESDGLLAANKTTYYKVSSNVLGRRKILTFTRLNFFEKLCASIQILM